MHIGVTLRNMGPQSSTAVLVQAALAVEAAGFESLWITDHIAIPPDDSEGSNGRYLDPLVTLAYVAGATRNVRLGTGVLILPYRPALPTAKQVATLQELSGDRLLLGVGIGWMDSEFRALGIDRHQRGRISDDTLEFLNRCFENDSVEANDQPFLFRPRPEKPPILIGGAAPHALVRAAKFGSGWLPMGLEPDQLEAPMKRYSELCAAQGKTPGGVTLMRGLPVDDPPRCLDIRDSYRDLGVERLVCAVRYDTAEEYSAAMEKLRILL